MQVRITSFAPLSHPTRLGHATVWLPSLGITLHGCFIYRDGPHFRVRLPQRPATDDKGLVQIRAGYVAKFTPAITFDASETKAAFREAVIAEMQRLYPDLFKTPDQKAA